MNWLVEDFLFAAQVISEVQTSGLAFGFFASLLAMSIAIEVRKKYPLFVANKHYFFRRGLLITLYVTSIFFTSIFVGLTLSTAENSLFSISRLILAVVGSIGAFLCVDYVVQRNKGKAKLFRFLFASLGIFIQFAIHFALILIPNNQQILDVRWEGLVAVGVLLFVCMVWLSRFAQETSVGQRKPLRSQIIYIFGLVGLNQIIALSVIGFVQVGQGAVSTAWWGLWVSWSSFDVFVSFLTLIMISTLFCYVYVLLNRYVELLQVDNKKLRESKQSALDQAATISEELELQRDRTIHLERAIELVQHDHEMSVDSLVAAVATLEDGVFEWDIEQETVVFSSAWRRQFGLDEHYTAIVPAKVWRAGIIEEDVKMLDIALHDCLTGKLNSAVVQIRYTTVYGSMLKLEISLVAVKNAYGLPSKAVGIIHDRTEEMDLELSIREELNEESLLSSRKSQFVSYLSHEIRTPMTVISSAKALLESALQKDSVNMETALHYVDQIGGALRTLRALVDETLMFMGSSFTRKHLNVTQLDINKLFSQFLLLEQRRRHGLSWLEFQLDPNLQEGAFYSDEYVFTQAMRQMLAFAEAKESCAGRIAVKLRDEESLNMCVELLEWPEWMVKGGQLEPCHERETIVPFKDDYLPFSLLMTKRVIRLINGRLMIKNRVNRHWLCLDFPSMKEEACRVS